MEIEFYKIQTKDGVLTSMFANRYLMRLLIKKKGFKVLERDIRGSLEKKMTFVFSHALRKTTSSILPIKQQLVCLVQCLSIFKLCGSHFLKEIRMVDFLRGHCIRPVPNVLVKMLESCSLECQKVV